jgi:dienelactone hydrolase
MYRDGIPWDREQLSRMPRIFPNAVEANGVQSMYYEGLPYEGRRTRVFAHYAMPSNLTGKPVPAMVLVHGGGGTAFAEWVRRWTDRGYAAISMDLEGHLPIRVPGMKQWVSHSWAGPTRDGIFIDCEEPVEDQWMYHAVASVFLAHTIIRSMEHVDPGRIGVTGISWGGIVASLAAGLDERFAFAIPVYGCGYLFDSPNQWGQRFDVMGVKHADFVKQTMDPSAYLSRVRIPMLWINMINDKHFPLTTFCRSYKAAHNGIKQSALCIHPGIGHSHEFGWKPEEIYTFADSIVFNGGGLVHAGELEEKNGTISLPYETDRPLGKAVLFSTHDYSDKFQTVWSKTELSADTDGELTVVFELPPSVSAYFVNLYDDRGNIVSTPIVERC